MTPRKLYEFFEHHLPVAAYIYPEVDSYFMQRIGEVQFSSNEAAKKALAACQDAIVCHHRLHATYRPVRFAREDEVRKYVEKLIVVQADPGWHQTARSWTKGSRDL